MIADVGGEILAIFGETVVLNRFTCAYVNGFAVKTLESTVSLFAAVRPVTGQELLRLPEGERNREGITVKCNFLLRTSKSEALPLPADEIAWHGKTYEVSMIDDRLSRTDQCRAICLRIEP